MIEALFFTQGLVEALVFEKMKREHIELELEALLERFDAVLGEKK